MSFLRTIENNPTLDTYVPESEYTGGLNETLGRVNLSETFRANNSPRMEGAPAPLDRDKFEPPAQWFMENSAGENARPLPGEIVEPSRNEVQPEQLEQTTLQQSDVKPMSPEAKISEELEGEVAETPSLGKFSPEIGPMIGATLMSNADQQATNYWNNSQITQAKMGEGPNGHAFDAMNHAEMQANTNDFFSSMRQDTYMLGSLGGPEGLAAASIASLGMHDWGGINQDTTPSTSGENVNAAVNAM